MPGILLSGPAGGGKTQEGRRLLATLGIAAVLIDFQTILAGLLGIQRNPVTGRYPERRPEDDYALALAEYIRRASITGALLQEVFPVVTNSDGGAQRRGFLLGLLGQDAEERVIDPGFDVVAERLAVDGELSPQCQEAINRWYGRL